MTKKVFTIIIGSIIVFLSIFAYITGQYILFQMKKYLNLIASIVFTIFLYFLYVVDNIVCSFGIGPKLPFKDFVKLEFYHKDVYIRLSLIILILLIWRLMV